MYYQIRETLVSCDLDEIRSRKYPYVAIVPWNKFQENNSSIFQMGIDVDMEIANPGMTKIQVNYDSLTGSFVIPNLANQEAEAHTFNFAIDERGIVFINDDGTAQQIIDRVRVSKKWKNPSLERFIYDFLEGLVTDDFHLLERYEKEMDHMEDIVLAGDLDDVMERLSDIRSCILDLRTYYEQLVGVAEELEENENNFFATENLRFFRLFRERVERLQNMVALLRDHTMQVRDLYNAQMDAKQNKKMNYLTIVATIFTPLTLITSWYGMNFKYMPELDEPLAYPIIIVVCASILAGSIFFFNRHKWF